MASSSQATTIQTPPTTPIQAPFGDEPHLNQAFAQIQADLNSVWIEIDAREFLPPDKVEELTSVLLNLRECLKDLQDRTDEEEPVTLTH